jgi:DNA-binding NtrC family response regulator
MYGAAMRGEVRNIRERHGIIGSSVEIQEIIKVVEQVAPTDITVLISGESGTGKEVIARAIHELSRRSKKSLITVNSGAIPEGILESELFGHERGSFTGASEQRKGYFELADGGTIILDEIGELPLSAQVKFLRVIENGEFQRVGSAVPRKVDVRVIAATNKDLESEVRHGRFRADLYFRLRSVNIIVPPLRKRSEDIPLLFQAFVDEVSAKNNIPFDGISDEAMELLKAYSWPGNVRELRNTVESMLILEHGKYLDADDVQRHVPTNKFGSGDRNLPVHVTKNVEQAERELILRALLDIKGNLLDLKNMVAEQAAGGGQARRNDSWTRPVGQAERSAYEQGEAVEPALSLIEMEKRVISDALKRYHGNRRLAARALQISERTLYRKIKEYGLG